MRASRRQFHGALTFGVILATTLFTTNCGWLHREDTSPERVDPGMTGDPKENPDSTRKYLSGLTFVDTPNVSVIECEDRLSTTLHIYPEVRSQHLSVAQAKQRGRIVARVINVGPNRCAEMHLAVRDTAYWWTGPNRGYALTTDFWRIPASRSDSIRHLAQARGVHFTGDDRSKGPAARIALTPIHPFDSDGEETAVSRFGHNSTWIACLGGCCESTTLVEAFY